jgi:DNA polymerase III delta prime subunit
MANYDFTTLNDKDFEELCRDLLNRSLNLNFNSFKYGRDEGIDLRHSTIIKDNSIIVQAKHYVRSGKSQLLAELKREAIKVKALDPTRYIIVTSVELSAKDQVLIKEIFKPYITNASDVIGPAILNVWLDEYKDIQTNHFKLWMSSVNIIQSIINQSIHGRSRFYFDQIKAKLSLYVTTQDLSEGLRVLTENKVLIISGEPGVGKTTLADVITFRIMSENFSLFKLESIQEGENVFSSNIEDKQLFYFDDFLGSIYLEYSLASGTDSALNYFIDRVRKTPNKYIILTTRTVILNQAFSISAKFKRGYLASEQIEIKLNKYTYLDKAKILYNHLYFRNINNDFKDVFYKNELYFWFIKHKNYNPRIIEFITDENRIRSFDKDNYGEFLLNAFINPEQIWSDSFTSQINDEQRFLLFSLFLFKDSNAMEDRLKQVYEKRLLYEISTNGHSRSNDSYNNSLKILLDGFIARHVNILGEDTYTTVSYLNPSLSDYIKFFLRLSIEERIRMIFSIIHLENLDVFLDAFKDETLSKEEMRLIMAILENDEINAYSSDVIPGNATLLYKIKLLVQMGTDNAIVDSFKKNL